MPIQVKNVFYSYNKKSSISFHALNGVSFDIEEGSFTAIVGHTGSGKSTLVQTFNAILLPTDGEVVVDDFHINPSKSKTKNVKNLRKHVGLVFQFPEYQLFDETVERDVSFGPRNFGLKDEEALKKAHEALLSVGIPESYFKRSPFELSGGEKRRVAIAGILAIEPDILVLDEPTAGLDPKGTEEIMSLLLKMNKEGKTIILVTHDMSLVLKYCNQVVVLNNGYLAFNGKPYELYGQDCEALSLEVPPLFRFAEKLSQKGVSLDFSKIKSLDDLIYQIDEWRNNNG